MSVGDINPVDITADLEGYTDEVDFDQRERQGAFAGWGLSAGIHAVALLILSGIVLITSLPEERPPINLSALPIPEQEEEEPEIKDILDSPVEIKIDDLEQEVIDPVVEQLEQMEEIADDSDEEMEDIKGNETAVASIETGGAAAFLAMGAGGAASGKKGSPYAGRKGPRGSLDNGISRHTEKAVEGALRWFKRHQSPNGMWDVDGYQVNCDEAVKCEPGTDHTDIAGDVACTAYALLVFLGSGHDHQAPGKYRAAVESGLDWLLVQKGKAKVGRNFCGNAYADFVATMAVVEAYGMTKDPEIRDVAQGSVDYIVSFQNRDENGYGLGWNYKPSPTRNDASVSGWAIMALKSARASGLNIGNGLEMAEQYIVRAWEAANPNAAQLDAYGKSVFPYTWNPKTDETKNNSLGSVGAVAAIFMGRTTGDVMLETLLNNSFETQLPKGYPTNTYYLYYNTLAMFQAGGERWKKWNDQVAPILVDSQRKNACFAGSWDYEGTVFHGHKTGRLLSTAYNALSLEVYYRYVQMNKGVKKIRK